MMESNKKHLHAACVTALLFGMLYVAVSPQVMLLAQPDIQAYRVSYALMLALACLAVFFWGHALPDAKKRRYAMAVLGVMPPVAFVMFEVVAGNVRTVFSNRPGIIALNLLLWYFLYFAAFAVTNRVRMAVLFLNILSYLFAVANAFVVSFRAQPIMPMDFKSLRTAATVASNFTYTLTPEMVLMALLTLLCCLVAWKADYKIQAFKARVSFGMVLAVCFFGAGSTAAQNLAQKAGAGILDFFRFNVTYQQNGYLLSSLQSIWSLTIEKPDGYSVKKVQGIADSIVQKPAVKTDPPENVIVIMNESFADLSVLGDVSTSEEMLPFISRLTENTLKGNLYVSINGGGTANSEFEFLTGNSMAFLPAAVVAYQMYIEEGDSSIVSVFHENGYRTVAFHPYDKSNYSRPRVYGIYQFDSYIGEGDREFDRIRDYTSDMSDYETLIDLYEEKEGGEKLFIFNITVQNHSGYNYEGYESTVSLTDYPGKFPAAEQFLTLMQESDRAFEMLVGYFSEVEERTAILLFGDHQPFLGLDFYEAVMGETETDITNTAEYQKKFETPYLLWTNYELNAKQEENISTNFLGSYLLHTLGFELPPYQQFLYDMQQNTFPALNINGYLDKKGEMHYILAQNEYQDAINQYQMLQYNNLFDNRNRLQDFFE